jgi:pilus assembly protein CpaE
VIQTLQPRIHVLILRDELSVESQDDEQQEHSDQILGQDARFRVTVAKAGYGEAVRAAQAYNPDVILLEDVHTDPVELVSELDEAVQAIPTVVVLDESERSRIHACVVAGARGCLVRPFEPSVLLGTMIQTADRAARRRKQLEADLQITTAQRGRVVAMRGAKGGVGTSALAVNLAVTIGRQEGCRVALVDAHPFGGDLALALNLVPSRTLADLIPHLSGLDDDLLASVMTSHGSGIDLLSAPVDPEQGDLISAEQFYKVLDGLCSRYDYVVVDCGQSLDPISITALDMAYLVLLVSTAELAALKNVGRFFTLGAKLGYSEAKLRLVVNRHNALGSIARADFERHLGYRMSFGIPNDRAVHRSLTRGEPLVTLHRTSRAAKAIERLARTVVENAGWAGEIVATSRRGRLPLALPSIRPFSRQAAFSQPAEGTQ